MNCNHMISLTEWIFVIGSISLFMMVKLVLTLKQNVYRSDPHTTKQVQGSCLYFPRTSTYEYRCFMEVLEIHTEQWRAFTALAVI